MNKKLVRKPRRRGSRRDPRRDDLRRGDLRRDMKTTVKAKLKVKAKAKTKRYVLNHHIKSVGSIPRATACRIMTDEIEPKPLTITLDYPLAEAVQMTVKPYEIHGSKHMDLGYVLWQVARQYKRIYKQPKRYGIWGHGIDDLWFEQLTIKPNGCATLFVGS